MSAARFRFVEGATSDLSFTASGDSPGEVFHAAAEALCAATVERPESVAPTVVREIRMTDTDLELLLLRFLNELIYLRDAEGLVLRPQRVACRRNGEIALEARLAGEPLDRARHEVACEVKAATAHGLAFEETPDGWRASVTLDVRPATQRACENARMAEIVTSQGTFTAEIAGPPDGELVLLLHGFPLSRHSYRAQLPALSDAGYRAVAPDQRGYSPGVRPDPRELSNYGIERLVADAIEIADASGARGRSFHLVGHDWGGQVAWCAAAKHPERVRSLCVLSRPHPAAFRRAYQEDRDGQQHRSRHHRAFHDPRTANFLLEDGAKRLRAVLEAERIPANLIEAHVSVLGHESAMEAALAWYRAAGTLAAIEVGPVAVPTLYVWGDGDTSVGPSAAQGTKDFVTARYRFETLPGVGHCSNEEAPALVNRLLLAHLASEPRAELR